MSCSGFTLHERSQHGVILQGCIYDTCDSRSNIGDFLIYNITVVECCLFRLYYLCIQSLVD